MVVIKNEGIIEVNNVYELAKKFDLENELEELKGESIDVIAEQYADEEFVEEDLNAIKIILNGLPTVHTVAQLLDSFIIIPLKIEVED